MRWLRREERELEKTALDEKGYAPSGDGVRDNIRLGQASMYGMFFL